MCEVKPILLEDKRAIKVGNRWIYTNPQYWYTDCRGCQHNTKNVQCAFKNGCTEDLFHADVFAVIGISTGSTYCDGIKHVTCSVGKDLDPWADYGLKEDES